MKQLVKNKSGFAMLEILITTIIIALLFYFVVKVYYKNQFFDKQTQQSLREQGISSSSYPKMIKDTKDKVKDINRNIETREKQFEQNE
jgi:Tfp pilus assembly protein PilV